MEKKTHENHKQWKHAFAICAYKESPYLEQCIRSVLKQKVKTHVILCTSTPNAYIRTMAETYDLPLYVRTGKSDIRDDWNYAYNCADAEWVTLAHQDDVYRDTYTMELLQAIKRCGRREDVTMFLTDYRPLKHAHSTEPDLNCRIRRLLRIPLKSRRLAGMAWVRKATLALGNSICCPTVTYHKAKLGDSVFTSTYQYNIDWDTFLKLAGQTGSFLYVDRPLVYYRVHDGATSKAFIENHLREEEDRSMFRQFWPAWIVRCIMHFYVKAYDTYEKG